MTSIMNVSLILLLSYVATSRGMSHSEAAKRLQAAGIGIVSSGSCSDRNNAACTSLEGVRDNTIAQLETLKSASRCSITVTGGTETGHGNGQGQSHWNGYKVDISLNNCINKYITSNFKSIGKRSDGAPMYKSAAGNIYANEGNHWDILYI